MYYTINCYRKLCASFVLVISFIFINSHFLLSQGADNCGGAVALTIGGCSVYTNNEDSESPGFSSCGSGNDRSDVWFQFTGDGSTVDITCTSDRNAKLAIYTACPGTMTSDIACVNVANNGTTATISLPTTNGTTYYVRIHRTGGGGKC